MSAILIPSRRGFIAGLASLFAAPAPVKEPVPWWIEERDDNGASPFIVNLRLGRGACLKFAYRTIDEAIAKAPELARMAGERLIA